MRTLKAIVTPALFIVFSVSAVTAQATESFFTLTGDDASGYTVPTDTTLVRAVVMERLGLTYERYQQTHEGAEVLGGQITLHRDAAGNVVRVVGSHYPDIAAANSVRISAADARGLVDRDVGPDGERKATLMIDPEQGRFFWRVETRRARSRWVHWIGAQNGQTLNKFDALTNQDCTGQGMEYDRDPGASSDVKAFDCTHSGGDSQLVIVAQDGQGVRQETHDQGSSRRPFLGPIATHGDNHWDNPGRESPGTGALVDAHYYMAHADAYFRDVYGFDVTRTGIPGSIGTIVIHAHYTKNYVNAFWNGSYFAFGDGDGASYDPLTSMDVAAHEFTHAVTEYTSDLIYQNESGALNESFSDIMAAVIERLSDSGVLTPEADAALASAGSEWLVGEDFDLANGDGFRNMADPNLEGDPKHYDERYTGTADNGGVHINSGIPNHAFYWLVENQQMDVQRAADIFYTGFTMLPSNADFCDARDATIAAADPTTDGAKVTAAWDHVGVDATLCDGVVVDDPPTAGFNFSCTGLTCRFTDASSNDVTAWSWDFGDPGVPEGSDTSTDQNPEYTYAAAGTYTVSLTVADDALQEDTISDGLTVSGGSENGVLVTGCSPPSGNRGDRIAVEISGDEFQSGATVDFGSRIAVQNVTFSSTTKLVVQIKVHNRAGLGTRDVTVTNPDGATATGAGCFEIN